MNHISMILNLETHLSLDTSFTWKRYYQFENISFNLEIFLSIRKNNNYSENIIFNLETPFWNSKHELSK